VNAWTGLRKATEAEHRRFVASLQEPDNAQAAQLRQILRQNAASELGRRFRFEDIHGSDAFRKRVPPRDPEDLRSDMNRVVSGEWRRLCGQPVVSYEQTSGTTSGSRLVPYTSEGLYAFRRAVFPWLHDLLAHRPGIAAGRAYWAVSPIRRNSPGLLRNSALRPVTEADYFGPDIAPQLNSVSAVPATIGQVDDLTAWRYLALRHLVDADDLTLISVWSPTFLTNLIDGLAVHAKTLIRDVAKGTVSRPADNLHRNKGQFRPRPERAIALENFFADGARELALIWPSLDTVSCWTHASAARFLPPLSRSLPHAWIQGKGLFSTEAAVSIPLGNQPFPVLAINSGFFEFVESSGRSRLCGEVEQNETYSLRITTHSGLYRYELGDRVRICGWLGRTPTLEFLGRSSLASDLVGEKLAEHFVQRALGDEPGFAMLAPQVAPCPRYLLFLDAETDPSTARDRAEALDHRLSDNPHYRYARDLGQLASVAPVRIPCAMARYQAVCLSRGQRLGDIKPPSLRPETDWLLRLSQDGPSLADTASRGSGAIPELGP